MYVPGPLEDTEDTAVAKKRDVCDIKVLVYMRGGSGIRAALMHKITPTKVRRSSFGPTPAGLRDNARCKVISQSSGGSWSARYAVDVYAEGSLCWWDQPRRRMKTGASRRDHSTGSHSDCTGGGSVCIERWCIECALAERLVENDDRRMLDIRHLACC